MRGLIRTLLALALLAAAPAQAAPRAETLKLERVVVLMRHGIRPPTKAAVTPPGVAADPWPAWDTPWGHLTAHGAQAVTLLGRSDRAGWSRRGVLPAKACPGADDLAIWADSDQRTIATGEALAKGLGEGCAIPVGHLPQGQTDTLFSPLDASGVLDGDRALAAIQAEVGDIPALMKAHGPEVALAQRVLGCCSVKVCAEAGLAGPCGLADLPSGLYMPKDDGRPKATGPLDFLPTAAQSIMLAYVEGKPMSEVGWGRIKPEELQTLMKLHSLKGRVLQRPPYIASHGAAPLARRMLAALTEPGAKVTVLVGHDTNIVDLGGTLDLHWQVASYPADTPPPGGGIAFELLRAKDGQRYVRAVYRSQTMDQMRRLAPLAPGHDAFRQVVRIPGCAAEAGPENLCPLATFARLVTAALPPAP